MLNNLLSERTELIKFVGVLAQCFFMKKCFKENDDTETRIAEQIATMIDNVNITEELKCFILGLLGVKDLKHNLFNLSMMVSSPQPQITSVIVHMACIIGTVTHYQTFWYQLIMMPLSSAGDRFPLIPFEKFGKEYDLPGIFAGTSNVTCNIMQIFLYGSLVIAFGLNKISSLNDPNLVGYDNDYIDMQIRQYWQKLQQVLQLNYDDVCVLLHTILFKSLQLFTAEPDGISFKESDTILMENIGHQDWAYRSLYQLLEELNGDNVVSSLEDKYRVQLPREGKESLIISAKCDLITIEKLDHALKVFVHRCLSSRITLLGQTNH
ncbi:unnamed protein product [Mytilus edulis]|uniref:Uncharacterized protein n=1 Tax=Mytilus edulis TaxID=6550 RepID=A0A8S3S5E7_MYTED|nr:unnamed protein product [Mytilus edulis]